MSGMLKKIGKSLGILVLGLGLGFGLYQGKEKIMPGTTMSVFQGSKPWEKQDVSVRQAALKPTISAPVESQETPEELPVLVLGTENTLVFNEMVTEESVAKFQVKAQELSEKLSEDDEIILVMNTPGGCIDCGMQMTDSLKALPQKVKTLTIFSASMGWEIVQAMDERMIIPSGMLMSHRASIQIAGELDGELDTRLNATRRQINYLDSVAAKRMKISVEDYKTLIRDEYWVRGFEALEDRAADKLVLARCSKDLVGTEVKTFMVMGIIPIDVTFSKCPMITGPLEIKIGNMGLEDEPKDEEMMLKKQKALDFVKQMYTNQRQFVKDYVITHKWQEYFVKK